MLDRSLGDADAAERREIVIQEAKRHRKTGMLDGTKHLKGVWKKRTARDILPPVLEEKLVVGDEAALLDRLDELGHLDMGVCDGDGRPDVDSVVEVLAESRHGQVPPGVHGHNPLLVKPRGCKRRSATSAPEGCNTKGEEKRTRLGLCGVLTIWGNVHGGGRVVEIGLEQRVHLSSGNGDGAVDRVAAIVGPNGVPLLLRLGCGSMSTGGGGHGGG